ncbi:MAG: hypothetical protein EBU61_03880, partial [Crocinitomicaceae bacterium]|nr:hypothetical protein [Crocinitomicaceae bacterium]
MLMVSTVRAQSPSYKMSIANDILVSPNVYEFDWYVQRTGTTPFELASVQMGLGFDVSILNGGTATATLISGTSALSNPSQTPTSIAIGSTTNTVGGISYRYINVAPTLPPGAGNGSIISSTGNCQAPGTRIIRVRITNSVPFASGTSCNHIFST